MKLNTASAVISFSRELENESAKFYEGLSQRFNKEIFLTFARDNKKYISQVQMAYYSVISDAIEGCFAFNCEPEKYAIETGLTGDYLPMLNKALGIEEKIVGFYTDTAEQSKTLMADVPRVFMSIVNKRKKRMLELASLIEKGG